MHAHLDLEQINEILNDRPNYAREYMSRHTTTDMFKKLANEGFSESALVLIDANFANNAIDNSQDVFAIKDGEIVLLARYHDGTKYENLGYLQLKAESPLL